MDHDLWLVGLHSGDERLVVRDIAEYPHLRSSSLVRGVVTYDLMTASTGKFNEPLGKKTRTTRHKDFHQ
ncbi:hypothetical protein NKJ66_26860 [Mesorhizobium sp. M0078]